MCKVTEIFNKHYKIMAYVAYQVLKDYHLAQDAISEAFIKIIKHLDKIPDTSHNDTRRYIMIVTRNAARTILAKRNSRNENYDEDLEFILDEDISAVEGLLSAEGCEHIVKVIESLPSPQSDIIFMYDFYRHTHVEIAEMLGITYIASKQRLARAKRKVRKILEDEKW